MITKKDKKLGKAIRLWRKQRGLTQEQLGDKVGVSAKYVQYLESAKRVPSIKLLYKIAHTLGVKVKDLFSF